MERFDPGVQEAAAKQSENVGGGPSHLIWLSDILIDGVHYRSALSRSICVPNRQKLVLLLYFSLLVYLTLFPKFN